ncbi:MAG: MATE family efflux transporter [Chloroflexota bacterium]|nr:MATE family efflux transporter [Chloroflexota bacterium]
MNGLMQHARDHVKAWDWRLFLFIFLFLGLPNVYQLYRVYLVGNELPDTGGLAIVSQWQFVGLVVEVFQEATVLAIFFFLGSQIRNSVDIQLDRAKSVFSFIFVASLVFSVCVFIFRDSFITLIGTSGEIQTQTREFLGISIFSIPFTILAAAIVVLFESLRLRTMVLIMAIVNVLLRFALDSLLFGGYSFSLDAGVVGVGWATLLASFGLFVVGFVLLLWAKEIRLGALRTMPSFADMRDYLRVALGSGGDSLIRNVAFFFMIIRIINTIGSEEIGGFWLANQIIWSFMLVPVLALADSAKAMIANVAHDLWQVRKLWQSSMVITTGMMIIWIVLVPAFPAVAGVLSDDLESIKWAVTAFGILFVPYVLFSFNTVMDSVFYGIGRTKYMAYQSIVTNGTVYLAAFLLYLSDIWDPTFEGLMMLFALGILVDTFFTVLFLLKVLYVDSGVTPSREDVRS